MVLVHFRPVSGSRKPSDHEVKPAECRKLRFGAAEPCVVPEPRASRLCVCSFRFFLCSGCVCSFVSCGSRCWSLALSLFDCTTAAVNVRTASRKTVHAKNPLAALVGTTTGGFGRGEGERLATSVTCLSTPSLPPFVPPHNFCKIYWPIRGTAPWYV